MGLSVIGCTFDPLAGVNAFRNLHRLGMEVPVYKDALYPGYAGHLNRLDVPSDRFSAVWDLRNPRNIPDIPVEGLLAADRLAVTSRLIEVSGPGGPRRLPVVEEREIPAGDDPLLVEIPFDFYALLRDTDVEDPAVRRIPLDWRMATRHVFHTLFDSGWRVVDFRCIKSNGRDRDFYVLAR
jgi:predicted GNAT superfamily acetyltransferase